METDSYLSLKGQSEGLFKSKGSKHFSYATPVKTEEDIKAFIESLKVEHNAARHFCYAYRLGYDGSKYRANDDGEPSNSAGQPILGVLKSNSLTNALIVVVRCFGGTKLGIGGLIEAYRKAGQVAISNGQIITCHRSKTFKVSYPYSRMGEIMNVLKRADISPDKTDFQLECSLEITVRLILADRIVKQLSGIEDAKVEVLTEN